MRPNPKIHFLTTDPKEEKPWSVRNRTVARVMIQINDDHDLKEMYSADRTSSSVTYLARVLETAVLTFFRIFQKFFRHNIRGLIKNIRDRIYCRKTKASTSYSKLSPSKYDPPDCMQRFQRSFHFSMRVW
jgi:hypothetical protein